MRVWITLCLIAVAAGCGNRERGAPQTKAPAANHDGDPDHGGHETMKMVVQRKLMVKIEPAKPQAGSPTKLVLQIHDDGAAIKTFDMLHEKLVHLSEAKTAPNGAVEFAAHFPKPGIYKGWGQFQRDGSVFTLPFVLEHKGGMPMPRGGGK